MNVATQEGETDHFTALDHFQVINQQLGPGVLDAVLINSDAASAAAIGPDLAIDPVLPESLDRLDSHIRVIARDMVNEQNPLRHDPEKLASALLELTNGHWPKDSHAGDEHRVRSNGDAAREELATAGVRRE